MIPLTLHHSSKKGEDVVIKLHFISTQPLLNLTSHFDTPCANQTAYAAITCKTRVMLKLQLSNTTVEPSKIGFHNNINIDAPADPRWQCPAMLSKCK